MDSFFLVFFLIALAVTGVMFAIALSRKGSVATIAMTKRRMVVHVAVPPHVVFDWLAKHPTPPYSVDDADPARGIVIWSTKPTFFTYGFLLPAFLSAEGAGTRIDLGIKSKVFQYGPLVTRAHREAAETIARLVNGYVDRG